jgi:hypothetical protein
VIVIVFGALRIFPALCIEKWERSIAVIAGFVVLLIGRSA